MRKIVELKIEETKAVVGGSKVSVPASASQPVKAPSLSLSSTASATVSAI
jgi:hypothetical protein